MQHKKRRGTAIVDTPNGIMLVKMKGDKFLLPGGGAHNNEARIYTAIRELQEETTLIAKKVCYLFDFESDFYNQKVFYIEPEKLSPTPSNEIVDIGYYPGIDEDAIYKSSLQMIRLYNAKYKNGELNLPRLTKDGLHYLMKDSFHFKSIDEETIDFKQEFRELREKLKPISDYNRQYHMKKCTKIVSLVKGFVDFAHSEGTGIWLSMAFTIKSLYELSDENFVQLMKS